MAKADVSAPMPTEVEASLVLIGDDPLGTRQALAELERLGGYRLEARPGLVIRDAYVDTASSDLLRKRFSLRLRAVDGRPRITLKGETPKSEKVLKVRSEVELDWSRAGLEQILAVLDIRGIRLQAREDAWLNAEPMDVLCAHGLEVIQERATERMRRDVVAAAGSEALAEMAIDAVTYQLGRAIRHDEVEIELKGGGEPDVVRELICLLRARFPHQLEPWSIAKLTLGVLLERLALAGKLDAMLTGDGRLSRDAYGALLEAARGAGMS